MKVRVTANSADLQCEELGTVEAQEAVRIFTGYSWQAALDRAAELEAKAEECADPDMTFTALPAHLVASAVAPGQFNVEVCLPHPRKVLGLFTRSRFYQFASISQRKVAELISAFCMDLLDQKHAFFAAQVHANEPAAT